MVCVSMRVDASVSVYHNRISSLPKPGLDKCENVVKSEEPKWEMNRARS